MEKTKLSKRLKLIFFSRMYEKKSKEEKREKKGKKNNDR